MNAKLAEFLLRFSQLEYAMKRTRGFNRRGRTRLDGGNRFHVAEANWAALEQEILAANLLDRMKQDPVASELWVRPPNSLVLDADGNAIWLIADPERVKDTLFEPIKWLRNIVAHGDSPGLTGRPLKLVEAGLVVLNAVIAEAEGLESLAELVRHARIHDELSQL